ncbi:hypothetical protein TIFTF001_001846 [Ficus carica]|uniref:Uncharacterized protein n=1 Tax=Ficus carica TaxID=3494 RepID=A0AA87Z1S4_FICCA|nr:hypothetical protein TIFTF001_001846 [Ficus carica]
MKILVELFVEDLLAEERRSYPLLHKKVLVSNGFILRVCVFLLVFGEKTDSITIGDNQYHGWRLPVAELFSIIVDYLWINRAIYNSSIAEYDAQYCSSYSSILRQLHQSVNMSDKYGIHEWGLCQWPKVQTKTSSGAKNLETLPFVAVDINGGGGNVQCRSRRGRKNNKKRLRKAV